MDHLGLENGVSPSLPPLYAVMGVPVTASQGELGRQFKRLSLELHPDRAAYRARCNASDEELVQQRYQRITEAYEVLSDPERRAAYDTRHGVNFLSRVTTLRETLKRNEATVFSAPRNNYSGAMDGAKNVKILVGSNDEDNEEEEEDEEYSPA